MEKVNAVQPAQIIEQCQRIATHCEHAHSKAAPPLRRV
jgi:hypothetical protein